MLQLTQKLGSGEMLIQEVPMPICGPNMVLVQNYYSIISSGTEGSTVSTARKSLLLKAKERPQQVKQVLDTLKSQGPINTYRAVTKKLDAYSPLGYSSAGKVIGIGADVTEFSVGDMVACAGAGYANHAEVITVPINLCVKVKAEHLMKEAAYNTVGAISLQGVRQADLKLGESCVIIGLGLLGQLAGLLLKASGVEVIGIDISQSAVDFAVRNSAVDHGFSRNTPGIEDMILSLTSGKGSDAVIISAATSSKDPINFAGSIARKKGKVVVLGAVPTGFDRDPHWYRKELELRMACSYGPGRYDLSYEEKGIDYPYAYVRWTEKRNMQAFQDLIAKGSINLSYLTTHEFDFENAKKAYDLILERSESFAGIAIRYNHEKSQELKPINTSTKQYQPKKVNVSFIGAGSYAQGSLLPNLPKSIGRSSVLTNSGTTSKRVAERFGFAQAVSNETDVLISGDTNTVFIATRHDSHGPYVEKALASEKHVFVEKPLCLNEDQLDRIHQLVKETNRGVMVGFNRRFSPFATEIKKRLGSGRMTMLYRVNAGKIPADTWVQDLEIGGGRIVGEACHFIDFLTFICGSVPISISAMSMSDADNLNDAVNISLKFKNGSVGVISYFSNGSKELAKEYVEINSSGTTAVINDFKEMLVYGKGKPFKKKLMNQDKGQKSMVESFISSIEGNGNVPIPMEETYLVTLATFKAMQSIYNGGELQKLEYPNR
jgi:predicted dehydrogenase/threonine dehydrogenase-like Zn-dependent dehydrogenase